MTKVTRAFLILASLAASGFALPAEAKRKSKASPRFEKEEKPNNGEISGVLSCYMPCSADEDDCDEDMEGKDEVAKKSLCPGMRPISHSLQKAKSNGMYVVAASRKFRNLVGLGAKVQIDGIPGIGVVCDICPGCEKHGKILDIASNRRADRADCRSVPKGKQVIRVVSGPMAAGKR